jgi:hypothetical protein
MDRPLALAALCALPVFAGLFRFLTGRFDPRAGYVAGMVIYWVSLEVLVFARTTEAQRLAWAEAKPPGTLIAFACFIPIIWVAEVSMKAPEVAPVPVVVLIGVIALINATTEEFFWRSAFAATGPACSGYGCGAVQVLAPDVHFGAGGGADRGGGRVPDRGDGIRDGLHRIAAEDRDVGVRHAMPCGGEPVCVHCYVCSEPTHMIKAGDRNA